MGILGISMLIVLMSISLASAGITYNGGTDTITVAGNATFCTEVSPCDFDDIYNADVAGGWGQVTKQASIQFYITAHLYIGDGSATWFKDTNKDILMDAGSATKIHVLANAHFQLGNKDANDNTYDGCKLVILHPDGWIFTNGGAGIKLYDCYINPSFATRLSITSSGPHEIIGCIFADTNILRIYGANSRVKNVWMHGGTHYGFNPGVIAEIDNVRVSNRAYGIYVLSGPVTFKNIVTKDITSKDIMIFSNCAGVINVIDSTLANWDFSWGAGATAKVYRQNSFDLKVTDKDGVPIKNATVKIWDKDNNKIWGGLLLDNKSFETDFGDWTSSGDLNWTRRNSPTPTSNSGPDVAYDGVWYIYTEASNDGVGYPYKESYLTYDGSITSEGKVSFWYHKYGADCGPLEVHAWDGSSWNTVWSRPAGSEGNEWFKASAYFPAGTANIRFKSTTGDFAYADTALDLITIYEETGGYFTDENGIISEVILNYGYYNLVGGDIPTMHTPHILKITAEGYNDYETQFEIDAKTDWTLSLSERTKPIPCPSPKLPMRRASRQDESLAEGALLGALVTGFFGFIFFMAIIRRKNE